MNRKMLNLRGMDFRFSAKNSLRFLLMILSLLVLAGFTSCGRMIPQSANRARAQGFDAKAKVEYTYAEVCRIEAVGSARWNLRAAAPNYKDDIKPLIAKNCVACHKAGLASGGLELDGSELIKNELAAILERMQRTGGTSGVMPPAGPLGNAAVDLLKGWKTANFPEIAAEEVPGESMPEDSEDAGENSNTDENGEETEQSEEAESAEEPGQAQSNGSQGRESGKDSSAGSDRCDESAGVNSDATFAAMMKTLHDDSYDACTRSGGLFDFSSGSCVKGSETGGYSCTWDGLAEAFAEVQGFHKVLNGYITMHWRIDHCSSVNHLPAVSLVKLSKDGENISVHEKTIRVDRKVQDREEQAFDVEDKVRISPAQVIAVQKGKGGKVQKTSDSP